MWSRRWMERIEGHGHTALHRALSEVVDAPEGQRIPPGKARTALAAAEVVAAGLGKPAAGLAPPARKAATRLGASLRSLQAHARAAVARIRAEGPLVDPEDAWDRRDAASEAAAAETQRWRAAMELLALRLSD